MINYNSDYLGNPKSLASNIELFDVKKLITIVIVSYRQLKTSNMVDVTWDEDRITLELFVKINSYVIKKGDVDIPIHQYPLYPKEKRGKPPTIDFVFRKGFQETRYFGFECKILNKKKNHLFKEYIEQGMMRFIRGKYAREEIQGGILAYIISGTSDECVVKINEILHDEYEYEGKQLLSKEELNIDDFEDIFKSSHERDINNIDLFHLFINFL